MKTVRGWWVPDYDEDMDANIFAVPEFAGRATYQFRWFADAFPLVKNFRHAIDIGAHIGLWSHMLASCFGKVTAFEPVPDHAACYLCNVLKGHVELHQCALGNEARPVEMSIRPPVSLKARVRTNEADGFTVPMRRLDEWTFNDVDFIKIDCEGYELEVLKGGEQLIRNNKPLMLVEQKPGNVKRYGGDAVALLESWGATPHWEHGGDYCMGWT